MGAPFAVSGESVDLLVGEVNLKFQQDGGQDPNIDLTDLLFIDRPGMGSEGGFISLDGVYPLTVLGWSDKAKGDTELRDFSEAGVIEAGPIRAARRDGPAITMPIRRSYDKYGLIMQAIPQMVRWGKHLWLWLVAKALVNENPKAYDGLSLFNTAHLVNQLDAGGDTYDNTLTNTDLDEAGTGAALDKLMLIPDLNGRGLANAGTAQPYVMVGTWPLYIKALHLFGFPMALIPTAAGTAPQTTVLAGKAKVIYNPFLVSEASDKAAAKKTWFIGSDVGRKPLIVREEEAPRIFYTGEGDWPRHQRDAKLAYCEAYCSVGPGEPRSIIKVTLP